VRLVSFEGGFGRVEGDEVVPMGPDLVGYLATGEAVDVPPVALGSLRLLAPVPRPGKVICIGLNYRDHAEESGLALPEVPILFPKFANSVIGPGEPIVLPPETDEPDYEAELGVVIGRRAHRVAEADALTHVAGYTCTAAPCGCCR
jgi:2-keto-4-pentenoate hydratase/2-oxohepta-3-ene-1,7-dioic acid hydratase in catechol pathway